MRKIKIVLADKSKIFRRAIKNFLESKENIEVIAEAYNGLELLELLETHVPDLILMDIKIPELNRFETAIKASCKYTTLTMVALTMNKKKSYLEDVLRSGYKAFIYKPEIEKKIMDVIKEVLNNKF